MDKNPTSNGNDETGTTLTTENIFLEKEIPEKSIQCLPAEILGMVFGFLTHTEKLIARLVCSDWDDSISKSLSKNSSFTLNSEINHQILVDSNVQWTRITLSGYNFVLAKLFKQYITTLDLTLPVAEFNLILCVEFLLGFPNAKGLTLSIQDSPTPNNGTNVLLPKELATRFGKFTKNLVKFRISCPYMDYVLLVQLLTTITAQEKDLNLEQFKIREKFPTPSQTHTFGQIDNYDGTLLFSSLQKVITSSSKTLKGLSFAFFSVPMKRNLYPEVIAKISGAQDLNLDTIWLSCQPLGGNIERDFEICQKFITLQKNLTDILLPNHPNESDCQKMVLSLPSCVRKLRGLRREHINPEFPNHLQSIKYVAITASTSRVAGDKIFLQPCPNVRELWVHRSWTVGNIYDIESHLRPCPVLSNLVECFPNIVRLSLVESTSTNMSTLFDSDLQLIIEHFQGLRVLKLDPCKNITDFGVSGIPEEYCHMVLKKGTLHIGPDFLDFPAQRQIGKSISDLKKLNELEFGRGSNLTDAGIYFGFRFGSTLKSLKIDLTSNPKVSDWGLHWLGKNNPGIEKFEGVFHSQEISCLGKAIVKRQLKLLESTQKFSWTCN